MSEEGRDDALKRQEIIPAVDLEGRARAEQFARGLRAVETPPPQNVQALGQMMREWLEAVVADAGTEVDVGGGMGSFDLWVKMGGREVYINLRQK